MQVYSIGQKLPGEFGELSDLGCLGTEAAANEISDGSAWQACPGKGDSGFWKP